MTGSWTPYEDVMDKVQAWADIYGYDDFLVTIDLAGHVVTELLICDNGDLDWINDWWEGEQPVRLLGFMPIGKIQVYGVPASWEIHNSRMVNEEVELTDGT